MLSATCHCTPLRSQPRLWATMGVRWGLLWPFPQGDTPLCPYFILTNTAVTLGHVSFLVWINECVGRICEIRYLSGQSQRPRGNCRPSTGQQHGHCQSPGLPGRTLPPMGQCRGVGAYVDEAPPRPQLTLTERERAPAHSRWQSGSCPVRGSPALVRGRDFLEPRRMPLLARW